jgi:hypothetical protein
MVLEAKSSNWFDPDRARVTRCRTRNVAAILAALASLSLSVPAFSDTTTSYTYDALGRLSKVTYNDGGAITTISYSYDAAGNRTSVVNS